MKKNVLIRTLALLLALLLLPAAAAAEDAAVQEPEAGEYDPMEGAQNGATAAPRLSDGAEGRGDITDPDKYWAQNGYPDDVAYAYEGGGELREENGEEVVYAYWEIGVVDADAARRQEIIDMLAPTCLVTFFDCRYSYVEREEAAQALRALDDPNILDVTLILNAEEVLVTVAPGTEEEYAAQLAEQYGGLVEVTDETAIMEQMDGRGDDSLWQPLPQPGISGGLNDVQQPAQQAAIWPFALTILCLAALAMGTRRVLLLQTARGGDKALLTRPGKKRVEAAVQNAEMSPREEVWESIRHLTGRDKDS